MGINANDVYDKALQTINDALDGKKPTDPVALNVSIDLMRLLMSNIYNDRKESEFADTLEDNQKGREE